MNKQEKISINGVPETMLQTMYARAKETKKVVRDCENLPFEAETFDVIINSQSFHHYPNPQFFLIPFIVY